MQQLDIRAPLIIIGAGRSGSTLLMRVLQGHPDISFRGEASFLVPRLWKECFENRYWHNWQRYYERHPGSALEELPALTAAELNQLRDRVGLAIARLVCELLEVRATAKVWGYKEPWNGTGWARHDWDIYDAVFPRATWLHLVRNPFAFARSNAHWNGHPLDHGRLWALLEEWIGMVGYARQRASTGRFFELKYEEIVARPRTTLAPVLESMGTEWHEGCERAFANSVFASTTPTYRNPEVHHTTLADVGRRIAGFAEVASGLGYEPIPLSIELAPDETYPTITKL